MSHSCCELGQWVKNTDFQEPILTCLMQEFVRGEVAAEWYASGLGVYYWKLSKSPPTILPQNVISAHI